MKGIIKKTLVVLLVVFVIMQFFGPEKNESDMVPATDFITMENPPENIKVVLKNACYDCHSNNTRYPWYNSITPINYWMADHVEHGSKHLDFSDWGNYSPKKKDHKLDECIEMVEDKEMPLNSYTWTHGDAKLTDAQIKEMNDWFAVLRLKYQGEMAQ